MKFTDINYYNYLQVSEQAEQEVIEAAYKRLARKYHPDNNSSSEAEEKMKLITAAYSVLSDKKLRKIYDEWLLYAKMCKNHDKNSEKNASNQGQNTSINMDVLFDSARIRYKQWKQCQENEFQKERENSKKIKRKKRRNIFILVIIIGLALGYIKNSGIDKNIRQSASKIWNGVTSKDLSSKEQDTETSGGQNTEVTTAESRQQYKVTTGGTRLNIRKEPRADAEIVQKLEDGTVCEASGNKSEDGSWIEVIIPESDQTGWASAQYLTEIPVEQSINVGGREITTSDIQRMQDFMSSSLPDAEFTEEEIAEMFQN